MMSVNAWNTIKSHINQVAFFFFFTQEELSYCDTIFCAVAMYVSCRMHLTQSFLITFVMTYFIIPVVTISLHYNLEVFSMRNQSK